MKKLLVILLLAIVLLLSGCLQNQSTPQYPSANCPQGKSCNFDADCVVGGRCFNATPNTSVKICVCPIGGDRDAHGCIPSAGYSWCEAKQKCLRVWEENC